MPTLAALVRGDPAEPIEPGALADGAVFHNVVGFVLAAADEGRISVPSAVAEQLSRRFAVQVVRSSLLRRELPGVVAALPQPPLLLKGPAVADRFYADPRLRPFVDIDLLVPREELPDGVKALVAAGFEPLEEFRPGFGEELGHDVHLVRGSGAGRVDVELHWRVSDDRLGEALSYDLLSSGAGEVGGALVAALPQQLLVVAVHLLGDRAKRLDWIHDLALVGSASSTEEWLSAFELGQELGLAWVLHRALDYPAALLGFDRARPLPPGPRPAFGPLRAAEELDLRASTHVGRLAALPWGERPGYVRDVLVPTRAGLEGTVGGDGAPVWTLVARHLRRALSGLAPRR
ncbi:MAG: nucleotidyltransferase family protein [Thermoleophilia bacterium]